MTYRSFIKIILVFVLLLTGCPQQKRQKQHDPKPIPLEDQYHVSTMVVKGHDYLVFALYGKGFPHDNPIAHDPECRFCKTKVK